MRRLFLFKNLISLNKKLRIHLWANPRNISTAIMYSFAQRNDMSVVDEPFYASYLKKTGLDHPGRQEILKNQGQEPEKVMEEVILSKYPTEHVFFKQMSHHIAEDEDFFIEDVNVILTRNPAAMINSFSKVISSPNISDLGLKESNAILQTLKSYNETAIVIDSDDLLMNPKNYLKQLCDAIQIPFDQKMLSWKKGKRKEDGIWAKHWYANVHESEGLQQKDRKEVRVEDQFNDLLNECMPYYKEIIQHKI